MKWENKLELELSSEADDGKRKTKKSDKRKGGTKKKMITFKKEREDVGNGRKDETKAEQRRVGEIKRDTKKRKKNKECTGR